MSTETEPSSAVAGQEIEAIAVEFERREFTPDELGRIKRTHRRSPRIGEARAEVYTFRASPSYKNRIRQRAETEEKSQSQVIRDALDAYL
ncbi:ribbon-helix-helix protein, CopG family [Candidatus Poriferisocius sp.]|uniref:ribbon-helix-helix protein, CopG family n=1 Tax=Candidatus Poriferisocius sp. TaxID=3101276 RepID=UPI003B5B4630